MRGAGMPPLLPAAAAAATEEETGVEGAAGQQNLIAIPMLTVGLAAYFVDRRWVQIGAPLVLGGVMIAYPIIFYPVLK